jgi:hypothetical protein
MIPGISRPGAHRFTALFAPTSQDNQIRPNVDRLSLLAGQPIGSGGGHAVRTRESGERQGRRDVSKPLSRAEMES